MSEDPIRKYSDALSELSKAELKVQSIASIIRVTAKAMNTNPYQMTVSNVDVGFPPEVAVARGIPHLNADNWPSAKQIAEALSSLHQKRHGVDNLWHSLSDEDKEIVSPPPSR